MPCPVNGQFCRKQTNVRAGQGDNTGRACVESSGEALQKGFYMSNNIHTNAKDVYSNRRPKSSYSRSTALGAIFGLEPSSGHLDGSFPSLKHFSACLIGYLRLEYGMVLAVDLFQLFEFLPDVYSEASCNGSTE